MKKLQYCIGILLTAVFLSACQNDVLPEDVTITKDYEYFSGDDIYKLNNTFYSDGYEGQLLYLSSSNSFGWKFKGLPSWIHITPDSKAKSNGSSTVQVVIDPNTSVEEREATYQFVINVQGKEDVTSITTHQKGASPSLTWEDGTTESLSLIADCEGGTGGIRVKTNIPDLQLTSSNSIFKSTYDPKEQIIYVQMPKNTTTQKRSATFTLRSSKYKKSLSFTLTQDRSYYLALKKSNDSKRYMAYVAHTGYIELDTNVDDITGTISTAEHLIASYDRTNKRVVLDIEKLTGYGTEEFESTITLTSQKANASLTINVVQLPESASESSGTINGYDYVDLGLGVKWAVYNIGAYPKTAAGNYYAWGETTEKYSYNYSTSQTYGSYMIDISGNSTYDAARKIWGNTWRMPTKAEAEELLNNCEQLYTTVNGVTCMVLTSRKNGRSLVLPLAGYTYGTSYNGYGTSLDYWVSTPSDVYYSAHYIVGFSSNNTLYSSTLQRYYGCPIRPVSY